MSERLKTGLIILGIYALFVLYLLFVSYRVEMLENNSTDNETSVVELASNN